MAGNNLHRKLERLRRDIVGQPPRSEPSGLPEHYQKMARALDGQVITNAAGAFCLIRTRFPCDGLDPGRPLVNGREPPIKTFPIAAFTRNHEPGDVSIESMVFVDTETTGLGGTGTVAFLVACGSVVGDEIEVRQYLIPDYSDEAAMLEALQDEFGPNRTLVTYNGAAFDLPVLRDRMIINRVARRIDCKAHIDLLPPVRRIFRRRLRDCTLGNIEKELLGFQRLDDIPGYLIPSIYFDWLVEARLDELKPVLKHNRQDIVSLYYVASYIVRAFVTHGESLDAVDDIHSLSRIFGHRREHHRVVELYQHLDRVRTADLPDDVVFYHAMAFKRSGAIERAVELLQQVAGASTREGFRANIELAKFFEHVQKDPAQAYHHAQAARNIDTVSAGERRHLRRRLTRLELKLKR